MYEPCLCGADDCPACFPGRAMRRPRYGLRAEDCAIRTAEYAAADAEAELAYQRLCDDATDAAQAATDAEAEAAYEDLDEAAAMETDIF